MHVFLGAVIFAVLGLHSIVEASKTHLKGKEAKNVFLNASKRFKNRTHHLITRLGQHGVATKDLLDSQNQIETLSQTLDTVRQRKGFPTPDELGNFASDFGDASLNLSNQLKKTKAIYEKVRRTTRLPEDLLTHTDMVTLDLKAWNRWVLEAMVGLQ